MPRCVNCGVPVSREPLFRVNPKGELPVVWGCRDCSDNERVALNEPIDAELEEIVSVLSNA
jgi:hypothetical protein